MPWYDNSTKDEYKRLQVNMWHIFWNKKRGVWIVSAKKVVEGKKDRILEEHFAHEDKYYAIEYAQSNVSPDPGSTKVGSGFNAGAQAGVRGKNRGGDFHTRHDQRIKSARSAAARKGAKSRAKKKELVEDEVFNNFMEG